MLIHSVARYHYERCLNSFLFLEMKLKMFNPLLSFGLAFLVQAACSAIS
jgi:hypothetical protein